MKKLVAYAAVLCFFAGAAASAQEVVQIDAANPPFMYDGGGKPAGLYCELIREAFKRMGTPVEIRAVPWKRALQDTDAGLAGSGGIYETAERLEKYDYLEPLFDERIAVYAQRGKDFPFKSAADLYGKTVNVISGWSYGDEFDAAVKNGKITVYGVQGDEKTLSMLAAGRNDAALAIPESGDAIVRKMGLDDKIVRLTGFVAVNKSYLAFGKKAGKKDLLAKFNAAIKAMKADGTFEQIVEQTMGK